MVKVETWLHPTGLTDKKGNAINRRTMIKRRGNYWALYFDYEFPDSFTFVQNEVIDKNATGILYFTKPTYAGK
jgi:hypothetical protein